MSKKQSKLKSNPNYVKAPYEVSCWTPERGLFLRHEGPPKLTKKQLVSIIWKELEQPTRKH